MNFYQHKSALSFDIHTHSDRADSDQNILTGGIYMTHFYSDWQFIPITYDHVNIPLGNRDLRILKV